MRSLTSFVCGLAWIVASAGCTSNQQNSELPKTDSAKKNQTAEIQPTSTGEAPSGSETFRVRFETTKGDFIVEVHPEWAPHGARRFRALVENQFYDECRFFRVVPDFMVQFGINGNPKIQSLWRDRTIPDDPVRQSNTRGMVTFAKTGAPNSRSTQIFVNYKNNSSLDRQGFAPFGKVIEGMDVVDAINAEYREQPDQSLIQAQGNSYLNRAFPNLDSIKSARIIEP